MAKEKKNVSCLGLFMRGFIITSLVLANCALAGIMVAVKFFEADYAAWTDLSHFSSQAWMVIFGVLGVGAGVGVLLGLAGAAVSAAFGGEKNQSSGGSKSASRAKPQSNRRTTI